MSIETGQGQIHHSDKGLEFRSHPQNQVTRRGCNKFFAGHGGDSYNDALTGPIRRLQGRNYSPLRFQEYEIVTKASRFWNGDLNQQRSISAADWVYSIGQGRFKY